MQYALPLVLLVAIVLVFAGTGRRFEETKSLLLAFAGIAVVTLLFWLVLDRAL